MNKIKQILTSVFTTPECYYTCLFFVFSSVCLSQTTVPFSYTGSTQTFIVPCGIDTIHVKTWGGGGSGGGGDSYGGAVGGAGAFVESYLLVTPGQALTLIVGGGAGPGTNCAGSAPGGPAGWGNGLFDGGNGGNAGGSGCSGGGGGGGGGSGILDGGTLLLVAGGGGGGSGGGQFSSGATGGGGGQDGNISPGSCSSAGISGASPNGNGIPGINKSGDGGGGGGGGGGYLGSSGGGVATGCDCGACGGGGGTSWSSGINSNILNGNGQVPGNSGDPNLPAGVAVGGGTSTKGGDGYIVITYFGGPPEADFTNTTVCSGKTTVFTNTSITSDGTIISASWDYGDGSPLEATYDPSHVFPAGGSYNVTLITTNSYICKDTITKPIQVNYTPTAAFTFNDVCFGDSVNFISTSTIDPGGAFAGYFWQFGDGATSNIQNPVHKYVAGTYTAVLIITSTTMCSDTISHIINTFDPPTSLFTAANECLYNAVTFTNTSQNPTMGTVANLFWDFGDGSAINSTIWSPDHLYAAPGNYNVSLITQSSNLACADTLQITITVYPVPVADFNVTDVCLNQVMNFIDATSVSSGTVTSWIWNFGENTPVSNLQNPNHTYASHGTFNVSLIATTNNSCRDTVLKNVVVHPLPVAAFNTSNVCDGSTAQFNNTSTIDNPDLIQFDIWNFGDGTTGSTQNITHLYTTYGSYNVELLVISDFGCADSVTRTFVVNPNPSVNFTTDSAEGCEPLCISILDSSTIATGTNIAWSWDFGDGNQISTLQDLENCFNNPDPFVQTSFSLTLTVTSDSACVSTLTKNNFITVYPAPEPSFTIDPQILSIIDPTISITDQTVGANSWYWDFGDGTTSTSSNPLNHFYSDTGTYEIVLITTTSFTCAAAAYQTVIVEPEFVLYIPNAFTPNGDGFNDGFICKALFATDFKMSIFNRWGTLIYKTDDLNKPWDGKANNGTEIAQTDVYIYTIEATDLNNEIHNYKGTVTLVR